MVSPLVVLWRRAPASGWQISLGESVVELSGAASLPCRVWISAADELAMTVDDPSLVFMNCIEIETPSSLGASEGAETSEATFGDRIELGDDDAEPVELVAFRADDSSEIRTFSGEVMRLIERVRASDTADSRKILSDALEESGALAEAEYLRRELALQSAKNTTSTAFIESMNAFTKISEVVGASFRYVVGRDVDGCAGLRWTFRCPRPWTSLAMTSNEARRFCQTCKSPVMRAVSEEEAATFSKRGLCVSVQLPSTADDAPEWEGSVAMPPPPRRRR